MGFLLRPFPHASPFDCAQYDAEVEAHTARNQRSAAAAAHADELVGDDDDDVRDRPAGHSDRAAARQLKDSASANAQLYALQADLFSLKVRYLDPFFWVSCRSGGALSVLRNHRVRPPSPLLQAKLAKKEWDNLTLQRLLQEATSGPPAPPGVPAGAGGVGGPMGMPGLGPMPLGVVPMGLQGLASAGLGGLGAANAISPHAVLGLPRPGDTSMHTHRPVTSDTWTGSDPVRRRSSPRSPLCCCPNELVPQKRTHAAVAAAFRLSTGMARSLRGTGQRGSWTLGGR